VILCALVPWWQKKNATKTQRHQGSPGKLKRNQEKKAINTDNYICHIFGIAINYSVILHQNK